MQGKLGNISEVKNPVAPMYNDAIMFKDKLFTDIELKANDGKVLEAHKVILATRSPLLFEMLLKDMQETQNDVANVKNFNSKIMTEVLLFIYCGNVKNLDGVARDLIHAAELYQMKELKKICIESIESTLSAENVLKTLVIANRFSETGKLFNKCLDVIMRQVIRKFKQFMLQFTKYFKNIYFSCLQRTSIRLSNQRMEPFAERIVHQNNQRGFEPQQHN